MHLVTGLMWMWKTTRLCFPEVVLFKRGLEQVFL